MGAFRFEGEVYGDRVIEVEPRLEDFRFEVCRQLMIESLQGLSPWGRDGMRIGDLVWEGSDGGRVMVFKADAEAGDCVEVFSKVKS